MKSLGDVLFNPLNTSTSKQQFSFSKDIRFRERLLTEAPDIYYELPSTKSNITCSFGKCKK